MVSVPAPAAIYWVDEPAGIDIVDGICVCRVRTGETIIEVRASVATLLQSAENAAIAYAGHLGDQGAQIIKLGDRGPMFLKG